MIDKKYITEEPISFKVDKLTIGITQVLEENRELYWILYIDTKDRQHMYNRKINSFNEGFKMLKLLYKILKAES